MTTLISPISVKPETETIDVILTAKTAISHHDAAVQDDSNRMLFNRQKMLLGSHAINSTPPTPEDVDRFTNANPVPAHLVHIFDDISFPEFIGCSFVKLFLEYYNVGDGVGLFTGIGRYEMLETRLRHAAIRSGNLRACWNRLVRDLQVPIHSSSNDIRLLNLLSIPRSLQSLTLSALVNDYRHIIAIARLWHTEAKLENEAYAEAVGRERTTEFVILEFDSSRIEVGADGIVVVDVPTVSSNSIRHQLIREPAWLHMAGMLGLSEAEPGFGEIPVGVEAIFLNGGNIRAGTKQLSNSFSLKQKARKAYPVLDLLGGVTDAFDLGESRLSVTAWPVAREFAGTLAGTRADGLPEMEVSIFDLVDEVTLTRQATERGVGQMIYTFETLAAGLKLFVRLSLAPFTSDLTKGALVAALDTFKAGLPIVAGQSARGFGCVDCDYNATDNLIAAQSAYEEYLKTNADRLREGLIDGTLTTGVKVLS